MLDSASYCPVPKNSTNGITVPGRPISHGKCPVPRIARNNRPRAHTGQCDTTVIAAVVTPLWPGSSDKARNRMLQFAHVQLCGGEGAPLVNPSQIRPISLPPNAFCRCLQSTPDPRRRVWAGSICVRGLPNPRPNSWIQAGHRKVIPGAPRRSRDTWRLRRAFAEF